MRINPTSTTEPADFLIIGSGFGGSVSALRLAEKGYQVLVLERGKRFMPQDFPKTNWNVFRYLWLPAARCFGIMGINFLNDIMILNGSGVGGGSLVYASTHLKPGRAFFEAQEWSDLADWEAELEPHFETANRMLGVNENPRFWPADHVLYDIAAELGQEHTFGPTPVAIFFGEPGQTVSDPYFEGQGPDRTGCVHCGGCMVGCRHGAKNTLDMNYLYLAEKLGAEIRAEANVLDIRPLYGAQADGARYEVIYEKTTDWFFKPKKQVRARNVIVSAGVLGTLNLLLKCRDESRTLPQLSGQLGSMVRSNSEALIGSTARSGDVDYSQGVAITSHFWIDDVTSVEPVRYPRGSSFIRLISAPLVKGDGNALSRIGLFLLEAVRKPRDFFKAAILPDWARDSTILLIMQTVENRMHLRRGRSFFTLGRKGLVSERDRSLPIPSVIDAGRVVLDRFTQKTNGITTGSINEIVLDTPNTAHILGGCGIAADETKGVIDIDHQAFNYPGLYIVDGSVIPANLGVNPSLTITAMAERAMSRIPPKEDLSDYVPLEQPASLSQNGHSQPLTDNRKVLLPLLAIPIALMAARFLMRKS